MTVRELLLRITAAGVGIGTFAMACEVAYWLGRHGGTPTDWGAMALLAAIGLSGLAIAIREPE